jgi:polyvinyl alcohol dehydrogenase (cytochrome)
MRLKLSLFGAVASALAFVAMPAASAQTPAEHPGQAVYKRACASCHDVVVQSRTPALSVIRGTSAAQLRTVLTEGVMQPMTAGLTATEVNQLIAWLTADQQPQSTAWTETMMCASDKRGVDVAAASGVRSFGADIRSTRSMTATGAGLDRKGLETLELAWTIGVPQTQGLGVGVTTLGDTAFVNAGGRLLALDVETGCAKWTYANGGSRNTPTIADIGGRKAVLFATGRGEVHALAAGTGELLWKSDGRPSNGIGSVRGGVIVHKDKVIVPISASGVAAAANPQHECCVGHGAVIALNAADGRRLWEYRTMKDADYTGETNALGVRLRGPSGAPIWSMPTIDEARNQVIVTTGENTSHPATETSDAVIALDLETGKTNWLFQAWGSDVWNMACSTSGGRSGPNCPEGKGSVLRDFDFGAQAILAKTREGRDVILAGQKSGDVWALDAASGTLLWNQRIGEGTALGGVHWGIAADADRVYVPINDPVLAPGFVSQAGLYAFDISTGKPVWAHKAKADCTGARASMVVNCETKYGHSAAPLVVDGAVISSTLDGKVTVFDAATGRVLNTIDTIGEHVSVNGVPARGGSIDSHGVSAGSGKLFVASGYGSFSQTPGNALMAFRPRKGAAD